MGLIRSIRRRRDDFLFNWNRRRYSYRMGWYYARLSMASTAIIVVSFVLFFLLRLDKCNGRKCGVFRTYACSPANYGLISSAFISLGSIYSIKSALSYLLSRLLYSFANYRTTDFMALGKLASILGALVKHIPFVISLCTICNGIICLTALSYLPQAQIIVDNCRLYFKSCDNPSVKSILDCNDPLQIISSPFLQLRCLPGPSEICKYSQELQSGSNPCTREKLRNYLISTGDRDIIDKISDYEGKGRAILSYADNGSGSLYGLARTLDA
ncbi:hypothetical protein FG386_000269, partial [Cryptosporidium ryanae]|uniref:uncharacterized protein n=1 Tax=Cryptosporidium ryanae TaxID=515981 RepID=UPI00351A726F